ncbi:MAG: helix-turn-helix transcriptional regulator [Ignavibacteriales bacterium]|nr:helix-turn-helix transcriptional regulator [Ignavibacteriales bacterium]
MTEYQKRMRRLKGKALGKRENQIWGLMVKGLTSREIGKKLGIAEHTVTSVRKVIYTKLSVNNVAGVISKWYEKK